MFQGHTLIRLASANDIGSLVDGDKEETRQWLGKQIKILAHQISQGPEQDRDVLMKMMEIFMKELRDLE